MLIAHSDEIGFVVKYIDDLGFIRFAKTGGVNPALLECLNVVIYHGEQKVYGVIGVRPIYTHSLSKNDNIPEISDLWIDIGSSNKEDAERLVSIGDYITYEPHFQILPNGLFTSKSIDNKSGLLVLANVLRNLAEANLDINLVVVASVQEEIGLRGAITAAYNINPDVCIAIDVTPATDYPNVNKNMLGEIKLNSGVVIPFGPNFNTQVQNRLKTIALKNNIKYQIESIPSNSRTDVSAVQVTRGGCITGLVSIPCRYIHSPIEVASLNDVYAAIHILTEFCKIGSVSI
jgi:endoglucanase